MKFETAIKTVLEFEGGYVNHPKDPGGETNFGISKRAFPKLDIKNLTREDAIKIYREKYWDAIKADELPKELRLLVFDCAVSQGPGFAIGTLQAIVGANADGIWGPQSAACLAHSNLNVVIEKYIARRLMHYQQNSRLWTVFGAGWSRRLLSVTTKSILA